MNSLTIRALNSEWKSSSAQIVNEIANYASFHRFKSKQIIFYSGHIPYGLFVLASGEVEIEYDNGKTEIISAPAFLGTSALENKIPYSGTMRAISSCETYFLSFSEYKKLKSSINFL